MSGRRILLVQPSLQPPGGGNGVAAWMLQALCAEHRVTVLTWWPIAVAPIDRFFGTRLGDAAFTAVTVPRAWRRLADALPVPAALLRTALIMRAARRIAADFDAVVGVHNEADYGRPAVQYVHYPTYLRPRPRVDLRWYHRPPLLLAAYYAVADRLAGLDVERMRRNVLLANSAWTAERVRASLGVDALVVHPPVVKPATDLPWAQRRAGFLAVGRIAPEKEYERIIAILSRVRRQVPDVTLTIAGTWDRGARRYYARVRALAEAEGDWIRWRHDLSRAELADLMIEHRYGIHGMREEHFGMAPAEMVRAGMIVWVPDGGGQVEIVGGDPRLVYDSEAGAVERIVAVLTSDAEQQALRRHLAAHAARFSPERFVADIQAIVRRVTAGPSA